MVEGTGNTVHIKIGPAATFRYIAGIDAIGTLGYRSVASPTAGMNVRFYEHPRAVSPFVGQTLSVVIVRTIRLSRRRDDGLIGITSNPVCTVIFIRTANWIVIRRYIITGDALR